MADIVGKATYETAIDNTGLLRGLKQNEDAARRSAAETERAYYEAGRKAGTMLGSAISGGLKIVGTGAALAFGIASKGAIELDQIVGDFTAATGKSGAEAKRAGQAINEMSSRNIQPMREIGNALIAVHTRLGLSGDAAEKTTQMFLRFARATKQDAAQAVGAFDDVLDSWGLTAADAQGIMDKLIVSSQRYGGSVTEMQSALASLAPAMRAMNMTTDDTIGLLNLFAVSGLDASSAQRALNSAVNNMPPGDNLNDVIARLAAIEDPALRAQEAIKIFGARAGVGLANAIKPGMKGLADLGISAGDAAGATEKAATAMDNTFGARIQLKIKEFTSALTAVGHEFGPVITGFASLASLAGAFSLDGVIKGAWERVKSSPAIRAVVISAGAAMGTLYGIVADATQTLVSSLSNAWASIRNSAVVRAGTAAAGGFLGAIFGAAVAAGAKLGQMVAAGFRALPTTPAVQAAVLTAGLALGGAYGTAISLGLKAGLLGIAVLIADSVKGPVVQAGIDIHKALGLDKTIFGDIGRAFDNWDQDMPWPWGRKHGTVPDWAGKSREARKGLGELAVEFSGFGQQTIDILAKIPGAFSQILKESAVVTEAGSVEVGQMLEGPMTSAAEHARDRVREAASAVVTAIETMRSRLMAGASAAANAIYDPLIVAAQRSATEVELAETRKFLASHKGSAAEVREAKLRVAELEKQWVLQTQQLLTYGTTAEQISKTKAFLASKWWVTAYKDATPEQAAALDAWRTELEDHVADMEGTARQGGKDTTKNFAAGIDDERGKVDTSATRVHDVVRDHFGDMPGYTWGKHFGAEFGRGLIASKVALALAAQQAAFAIRDEFRTASPPGPRSSLHDISKWGYKLFVAYADGITQAKSVVAQAARDVAESAMTAAPYANRLQVGSSASGAMSSSGGTTINGGINAPITVNLPQGWRGTDAEIADIAARLGNHLRLTLPRPTF